MADAGWAQRMRPPRPPLARARATGPVTMLAAPRAGLGSVTRRVCSGGCIYGNRHGRFVYVWALPLGATPRATLPAFRARDLAHLTHRRDGGAPVAEGVKANTNSADQPMTAN